MAKKVDVMFASIKKQLHSDDEKVRQSQQKSSKNMHEKTENTNKKPFDKKAYRLKKYSNKYKIQKWEDQRKEKMMKHYKAALAEDLVGTYKQKSFDFDVTDSNNGPGKFVRHPDWIEQQNQYMKKEEKTKVHLLGKAREQYKKVEQEKLEKQQARAKAKEEKQKKIEEHKKKRQENFKRLSKKTKKGQPVMSTRLDMLFDKIKKNTELVTK